MAKKTRKATMATKVAQKPVGKSKKTGKPVKKVASKKSIPKAKASGGEFKVSTGPGASAMELGQQLVSLFNQGKADQWIRAVWAPQIESIEGVGMGMGWRGKKAVEAKNAGWMATHKVHGASAEGPYVGSTGFCVKLKMDVEDTTNGQRMNMEEIGTYTVKNGKIIREEFMYHCGG